MEELVELEPWRQGLVLGPLGLMLLACAWTDFRERKVYNAITYPAFAAGLIVHTIAMGLDGLLSGLLAAVVMLALGLLLLPFRWIGAGDIKLLIATAAFVGGAGLVQIAFYGVLVGAVMGIVGALFNGYLWEMLRRIGRYLRGWVRAMNYGARELAEPMERDPRSMVPFAIALLTGAVLAYTEVALGWPRWFEIFRDVWF